MKPLFLSSLCLIFLVASIPVILVFISSLTTGKPYYGKHRPIKSIERKYRKAPNYDKIRAVDDDSFDKFWYYPYDDPAEGRRAVNNKIDAPSIVTYVNQTEDEKRYFYRYLFRGMQRYSPEFLIYPFPLTYSPSIGSGKYFPEGGFISMDKKKTQWQNTFKHYESEESVTFFKSKSLYDVNIGVMKLDVLHNGIMKDLFFESDVYCSATVTYIGHWGVDCIRGKDFKPGGATKFVYLNVTELIDLLTIDNFGILVLPDHIYDTETTIANLIGTEGRTKIRNFVAAGGVLYSGGKSVAILEWLGVFPAGSYDKNLLVYSDSNRAKTTLCNAAPLSQANVVSDRNMVGYTLCYGTPQETYLLQSYKVTDPLPSGLRSFSQFDNTDSSVRVKKMSDGTSYRPGSSEKLHALVHRGWGDGHVIHNVANPGYHSDYFSWFYSALFLAMSKDMAYKRGVELTDGKPIPAMESGVRLGMNTSIYNVYNMDITDVEMKFYLPHLVDGLEYVTNGDCNEQDLSPVPMSELNSTGYVCTWPTLSAYEEAIFNLRMEILDASVTQKMTNVLISYMDITYTDHLGRVLKFPAGAYRVDTSVAALLRCNVNPDPSSFYPIKGRGNYIDNVMPCENKEDTIAYEVEHVAIVPLVSPAVDGGDQSKLIEILKFWNEYYDKSTNQYEEYPFPFTKLEKQNRDYDILDYKFLSGKGVLLNADWDTPVKAEKEVRGSGFPNLLNSTIDVANVNYSTTVTNQNQILRQIYFADSDMFFEHATQRQLVFVDTTTEDGSKSKYGVDIRKSLQESEIQPGKNVTKIEFSWIRADIYFYDSDEQYVLPVGLNYSHVITLDKYPKYNGAVDDSGVTGCYDGLSKKQVKGYFNKSLPGGLKYNEWGNELINRCDKVLLDPNDLDAMTGGEVKMTRYILPIHDERVTKASDIHGFNESTGENLEYPDIKFKIGYEVTIPLDPAFTRRGGKFEMTLPYTFKANPYVFFSADHVAFSGDTDITGNKITASFKRGLMPNENWGKMSMITMFLEELDTSVKSFNMSMDLYELKYDITKYGFEEYVLRTENTNLTAKTSTFFSLPAIRMHFRLNRSDSGDKSMKEYELIEPLARYGVYYQELLKHRTVWGLAESHLVSDAGQVSKSGGFSLISQVGISSIPFIEYLTVGAGQVIPAGLETTRVTWRDIWGRKWVQPLRSVFPDVPPIPPPLRNFMMTTTFEVTHPETGERVLEWDSEMQMDLRILIKLKNNYPKYFEITTCVNNSVHSIPRLVPSRVFEWPFDQLTTVDQTDKEYISLGHRAYYGGCFMKPGTILSGEPLTSTMISTMNQNLEHCRSNLLNATKCIDALKGIPTVSRRTNNLTTTWNKAPLVEEYYPTDYIKENMWDLTHYDYDDNAFDKAYKYHMDNNLPNLDIGIKKPHNIIAQPIWKGYGFQIEFDRDYSLKKYPLYKGWWSDNLQNKDHTVLAGQDKSFDVSVDKKIDELIPSWVDITDLEDTDGSDKINRRTGTLKNIYACLFNRKRVKMSISNPNTYYVKNVYPNNVIPIIPSLDRYGPEYTNYDCDVSKAPYDNYNISKIDNTVYTTDARDWLYFGANLRGNSFETVNVAYKLKPFEDRKFEGLTKVNDGGRFVYWNPANGPNSFLIVDNPVSVIRSARCDCTLEIELFPKSTTTFNSEIYHLVTISDPAEIDREYPISTTIEHYGFGDVSTSTYVGGTEGSVAMLSPGDTTYVKITVYNNAGFDFNMLGSAIDFEYHGSMAINADDLMKNTVHAIKVPTAYNFMNLKIPDELKPHLQIIPSDHNSKVASLFFDFQNINTVTIQDGFKADYFYKIHLNSTGLPASIRGKIHEIGIDIVESHFESLPRHNDPTTTNFHDYHIKIPPISFGIKFGSEAREEYQGKVYHTLGQSTDLALSLPILEQYEVLDVRPINRSLIEDLRTLSGNVQNMASKLRTFYDEKLDTRLFQIAEKPSEHEGYKDYDFDLSNLYDVFPKREFDDRPPTAEFTFLIKSKAKQIPSGFNDVDYSPLFTYNACGKREKSAIMETYPNYRSVYAKGPFLEATYRYELLSRVRDGKEYPNPNQYLYPYETGTMRVDVTVTNIGSDVAYNVNLTLSFPKSTITPLESTMTDPTFNPNGYLFLWDYSGAETTKMTIVTNYDFSPSIYEIIPVYVTYIPPKVIRDNEGEVDEEILKRIPKQLAVIQIATSAMDLVSTPGEVTAEQELEPYSVDYTLRERDRVRLEGEGESEEKSGEKKCEVKLKADANFPVVEGERIVYQFYMRNYSEFRTEEEQDEVPWTSIQRSHEEECVTPVPCDEEMEFKVETQEKLTGSVLAEDTWVKDVIPWQLLFSIAVAAMIIATGLLYYCCMLLCLCLFTVGGSAALAGGTAGVLPTVRKSVFMGFGPLLGLGGPEEEDPEGSIKKGEVDEKEKESEYVTNKYFVRGRFIDVVEKRMKKAPPPPPPVPPRRNEEFVVVVNEWAPVSAPSAPPASAPSVPPAPAPSAPPMEQMQQSEVEMIEREVY